MILKFVWVTFEGAAFNYNHREDKDYYTQPGNLYRLVPAHEQERIHSNVAAAMEGVPDFIKIRAIARFYQADENCGKGIAAKAGIQLKDGLAEVERQKDE